MQDMNYLASIFHNKLNKFLSRYRDPLAMAMDVVITQWDQ